MIIELNIADDTLGFVYENKIAQDGVNQVKAAIEKKLESHDKINIYLEEDDVDEIEIRAFIDHTFFDISYAKRINRLVIVSNRSWIRRVVRLKDLLMTSDVKAFSSKKRVDALCWVMKK
ncbi:STAS/SEC14 domain-containing protein [Dokdonia sp. Asnod1-B02]|jgi:hypothetical protein|uniref:STAS/SEC14 domain-containing protein n=1 Tax=Dokdonia sp. Asnod1-B02 TaxID=3160573 RepID=UPI0030EF5A89|tara:strand:- start:1920 stop:2276 length:357 start_codon:yes stop_codon:yes gene_type:complete